MTPDQEAIDALAETKWDDAIALARSAIYDDGRGMIGRNRNYLENRVARMIVHFDRELIARLRSRGFDIVRKE